MTRSCLLLLPLLVSGCLASQVLSRVIRQPHDPRRIEARIEHPQRPEARLAVLWVGHATVLIQMDDRFILTDPVFTRTVGELSPRLVEPGIDPQRLPAKLTILISHLHFDHLSFDSLETLKDKTQVLLLPRDALPNLPRYSFEMRELGTWQSYESEGLRVTAVPVRHSGGRWILDNPWNRHAYTGYVLEYHGLSVYFGGDTVFDRASFVSTRRKFPTMDLALLPICPLEPRGFMRRAHMDPEQALDAFSLLGARQMVPIHFDTFINSADRPGDCSLRLLAEMAARNMTLDQVLPLRIGEQRILLRRAGNANQSR